MKERLSKSKLAIVLSQLEGFKDPKVKQEQYLTDSEVGASVLWGVYLLGDIENKSITDLGCGTGLLGIGALMLGAKSVLFVDIDKMALNIAKKNILKVKSEGYAIGKVSFRHADINQLEKGEEEVVLQNPPFGTKVAHNDIIFLKNALKLAPVVYSIHKSESKEFLERFCAKNNAKITHIWDFKFPLKATFAFHRRQIHRINVSCFRLKRIG